MDHLVPPTRNGAFPEEPGPLAVIGTGYVGMVVGACLASFGHRIIGVDVDPARVAQLQAGHLPFYEPGLDTLLRQGRASGNLSFTTDLPAAVAEATMLFVTVGTPSSDDGSPDLRAVFAVADAVAAAAPAPRTLVLKSTVPVGATDIVKARVGSAASGLVQVVANPEFLREGQAVYDFLHPARVVIGADPREDAAPLVALYRSFVGDRPVLVMDPRSAEMTKYTANAFLATKVSFINEIAALCQAVRADVELVRHAVGLDPRIGQSYLGPGVGYGGSCLPKDLRALDALAASLEVPLEVLRAVQRVNAAQPLHLVRQLVAHYSGSIAGRRVALWGLAFKPGTDDVREAPALALARCLHAAGARVAAYDPQAAASARAALGDLVSYGQDMYEVAQDADALVVATEWPEFRSPDFSRLRLLMANPVVLDGRNLYNPEALAALGFAWYGIGRGAARSAVPAAGPTPRPSP